MFKHYTVEEVARELECRSYYSTVAFGFIVEAVNNSKKELELSVIYDSDIDTIDSYIRENFI